MESSPSRIPTRALVLRDVPDSSADWAVIGRFALTFDPAETHGQQARDCDLRELGPCSSVVDLRCRLFFEQRRWNHFGRYPDPATRQLLQRLVYEIRLKLSAWDGSAGENVARVS